MSTEQLTPCAVTIPLYEKRHLERMQSTIPGLIAECNSLRAQRDELRAAADRALAEIRAGNHEGALAVLEAARNA